MSNECTKSGLGPISLRSIGKLISQFPTHIIPYYGKGNLLLKSRNLPDYEILAVIKTLFTFFNISENKQKLVEFTDFYILHS